MPIIAVANQKGGVGKTTTTLNLGAAIQEAGKRVLLVDLDPQGNLTVAAGIGNPDDVRLTVGDLLLAASIRSGATTQTLHDAIVETPAGLDLVPSNGKLSAAELAMVSALSRELMLKSLLRQVKTQYDYILVDCLPSLGLVVINALAAADGLVVPVQADYLAMQGLGQILETVGAVQERLNPDLEVYGILLTLVDQRTAHAREVVSTIRESFDGVIRVFDTEVRLAVVLKDSVTAGVSILEFNSGSESARAYRRLAAEVLAVDGEIIGDLHTAAAERPRLARTPIDRPPTVAAAPAPPRVEPVPPPPTVETSTEPAPARVVPAAEAVEPVTAKGASESARPSATRDMSMPTAPDLTPELTPATGSASAPATPGPVFRPRTLLTSIGSSSTKLAQARALDIATRSGQAAEPTAAERAPAIPQHPTVPAVRPAPLSEFLAGRPEWLGSI